MKLVKIYTACEVAVINDDKELLISRYGAKCDVAQIAIDLEASDVLEKQNDIYVRFFVNNSKEQIENDIDIWEYELYLELLRDGKINETEVVKKTEQFDSLDQ